MRRGQGQQTTGGRRRLAKLLPGEVLLAPRQISRPLNLQHNFGAKHCDPLSGDKRIPAPLPYARIVVRNQPL